MTEAGVFRLEDFRLAQGGRLPMAELAYITQGTLAPGRDNVVLMTHGYTSSHRYIEAQAGAAEGSWSGLVGPGCAIDTSRLFVVSCNALGGCHGSTGPASENPDTGRSYGADFPLVTFEDNARLQRALLDHLGVRRLHTVAGPSMGGFQALQWAVQYPDHVNRVVAAVSGLRAPRLGERQSLVARLCAAPGWNGGHPRPGALEPLLTQMRVETLTHYGMDTYLADQGLTDPERSARLQIMAREWARNFHPWSLVSLRDAIERFDVRSSAARIQARVLLALGSQDAVFPAAGLQADLDLLRGQGVDASGFTIVSRYGHLASGIDWQRWAGALRTFLA